MAEVQEVAMGILVQHVQSHPKTGRLSFRRAFPPHLLPFIPAGPSGRAPVELKISLGTKDASGPEFHGRYADALAQFELIVAKANKVASGSYDALDAPRIAYLATAFEIGFLEHDDKTRWSKGREGLELLEAGWDWKLPDFKRWRGEGDWWEIVNEWGESARQLIAANGLVVDPADHDGFEALCRELNNAAIRAGDIAAQRMAGACLPTPALPEATRVPTPATSTKSARVPLLDTFDAYAKDAGIRPLTARDWRPCIVHLQKFLTHDDAARITRDDLMRWKDQLLTEPGGGGCPRSPVTVRGKYIGSLKAMLNWAVEQRLLPANVASGFVMRVPKKKKLRERSFTTEEARAILTASLIPPEGNLTEGSILARRWIPWLCAYSGARVNELTQLRAQDIRQIDGHWTMNITPEAGKVKNDEARLVPLHSHVIEQGFLAVVESKGSGTLFYDPNRRRVESDTNRHSVKVGQRLAKWVREEVGVDDPNIAPNHGWRNTFKTMAYAVGIQERIADAIQGHAAKTIGQAYASVSVTTKAEAIASLPRYVVTGT